MQKRRKKNRGSKNKVGSFIGKLLLVCLVLGGIYKFSSDQANGSPDSSQLNQQVEAMSQYNFIRTIAPLAQNAYQNYQILPSITLAQACLESDFGASTLASKYHNLFGIKAYGNVPTVNLDTKEYVSGKWITISGSFRVYESDADSVNGHSRLIANGTTWNSKQYASVLAAKDYKTAAHALYKSGYATDPTYPEKLIEMIELYHLDQYDKI
ncbi:MULTISPECIES: glycoside hydrolase family 73 protein [unclassified Lactococcus]|uniref:glycoside hydrolase family 73 protein n=1 Tax=unclassified Lactococcus TaxID=2643510 RepID=UPI0011CB2A0B|nr:MULTISPECIES: glycoside hydrolase family 73 protein [unclassified Lactococcus]MQW23875.1 N-acetyl-muramidase [Lactococcus sp. dk101]TXK37195.1 N-acetyl-muramidase [Lactococcus sp. dk310]TXK48122.1 N-acetyl-muramidase [Lactococcus sp. dk322]